MIEILYIIYYIIVQHTPYFILYYSGYCSEYGGIINDQERKRERERDQLNLFKLNCLLNRLTSDTANLTYVRLI